MSQITRKNIESEISLIKWEKFSFPVRFWSWNLKASKH